METVKIPSSGEGIEKEILIEIKWLKKLSALLLVGLFIQTVVIVFFLLFR